MALGARLNLRQSQSVTMTPQLLQSIRLLQLTHLELERFIMEEVERNPLLSREGDSAIDLDDPPAPSAGTTGEIATLQFDTPAALASPDMPLDNVFPDDPGADAASQSNGPATRGDHAEGARPDMAEVASIEDVAAKPVSLRDHVADQIATLGLSAAEMIIGTEIADTIDERGYVQFDADMLAERLGTQTTQIDAILSKLQSIEPPGLFARDLAECLALQAARADRLDPAMASVLANLELLANRDFKALKRISGLSEADLFDVLQEIRAMSPHPGRTFEDEPTIPVVHDVIVSLAADGGWRVELNPDALPRVLVDRDYYTILTNGTRDEEEKKFVSQCFADATWLERSLDQRATTILKVASEIVKRQDGFLTGGVKGLKPMTMRMIADAIDMHESTVSRVVANKYILTPRGLFEFRYFFTASIGSSDVDGDDHSSESVRQRIRQMVDAESADAILSDDAIADALKAEGMDIARRTVAKYRDLMHIPSSVQRRREKRAAAKMNMAEV